MAKEMPKTARVGRDNQRKHCRHFPSRIELSHSSTRHSLRRANPHARIGYAEAGERLVCGIVALSAAKDQVLLIESTRRGGWVLPKGGWETDEATAQEAAKREAWEEAGVVVTVARALGTIADRRGPAELTKHAPRALFHFFEAAVDREEAEWPEKAKRARRWMRYPEAREALKGRPELAEALERSSLKR